MCEKHVQSRPLFVYGRHVARQLTVIMSFLGGFSFAAFVAILTSSGSVQFSKASLYSVSLSTFVLITASIVGVYYDVYFQVKAPTQDTKIPGAYLCWFILVDFGILVFFFSVVSVAFSLSTPLGVFSIISAATSLFIIFWSHRVILKAADSLWTSDEIERWYSDHGLNGTESKSEE